MPETSRAARAEGRLFKIPAPEDVGRNVALIKKGLPTTCFTALKQAVSLSDQTISDIVNIPISTLARRKKAKRFTSEESERLLRLLRITERALGLFEDMDAARRWLNSPAPALEGKTPLQYADTEPGAHFVLQLIIRLEHGVYS